MAPRVNKSGKGSKASKLSVTEMLASKGFTPDEDDIGTVIEVDGKNYIVKMKGDDKVFEEYTDDDLKSDKYESEPEVELVVEEHKTKKEKKKDELVEEPIEEDKSTEEDEPVEEPKKKTKAKKEKVVKEPKTKKGKKKDELVEEPIEDDKSTEEDEPVEEPKKKTKAKKEKVVKEPKVKKEKVVKEPKEKKEKRHRDRTPFNQFISDKMFELKETYPDINGRERFSKACELWRNLDADWKKSFADKFHEEHPRTVAVVAA